MRVATSNTQGTPECSLVLGFVGMSLFSLEFWAEAHRC